MQSKIYLHESLHPYAKLIFERLGVKPVASNLLKSTVEYLIEGETLTLDEYLVHVTFDTKYKKLIKVEFADITDVNIIKENNDLPKALEV